MPAIDLLQQWQDAEGLCFSLPSHLRKGPTRRLRGRRRTGATHADVHQATVRYQAYLEQVTGRESPEPTWKRAADAERAALPGPKHRPSMV